MRASCGQRMVIGLEMLESRELLSSPVGGWAQPVVVSSPPAAVHRAVRSPRRAALQGLASVPGIYSGQFQSPQGIYGGAVSITIVSQESATGYLGFIGYDVRGSSQKLPVQIRLQPDGQFAIRYFSVKLAVQATGRIDLRTGEVTGQFRVWARGWSAGGDLALSRTQVLADPRYWDPRPS